MPVYTSGGSVVYVGRTGSIYSYNPSYRSFTAEDEDRMVAILSEWRERQRVWEYTYEAGASDDEVLIDDGLMDNDLLDNDIMPTPTATPVP
jgi:hypothetical protein